MEQQTQEKMPVLLFLIEHRKIHQIVKTAFRPAVAHRLLIQYGDKEPSFIFTHKDQERIQSDLKNFTMEQIIQLRGSHERRARAYKNPILTETLRLKYQKQRIDQYTRLKLWTHFTEFHQRPKFYQDLAHIQQVCPAFTSVIEADIRRTHTTAQIQKKMREVLYRFAKYNPYIGYIQGMNEMAAFMLEEGLSPAKTFFILKHFTEQILPVDYYTNMKNIIAYIRILVEMLYVLHPRIYEHIKKILKEFIYMMNEQNSDSRECLRENQNNALQGFSLMFQFFVCIFTRGNLERSIIRIIWDFVMIQGMVAMFKAAIIIHEHLQETILKCNTFQQYKSLIQVKVQEIKDETQFKKRMIQIQISPRIIEILKQIIVRDLQAQQKKNLEMRKLANPKKQTKQVEKNCDRGMNYCVETLHRNTKNQYAYEVLVFRSAQSIDININHQYLEKLDKQFFPPEKMINKADALMIGRIFHTCRMKSDTITESSMSEKTNKSESIQADCYSTPLKLSGSSDKKIDPDSQQTTQITKKKLSEQEIRLRAAESLSITKRGLQKSESTQFLQSMVKNASLTNLQQFFEDDDVFS